MKPHLTELLRRYLRDETTPSESWTVEQWYEARDMPLPTPPSPAEQAARKARAWERIQRRTRPRPGWQRPATRLALAAGLVVSLGLGTVAYYHRALRPAAAPAAATARHLATRRTAGGWLLSTNDTGRPQALPLADGSRVTLATGSSLRYPARFDGATRVVALRGEAFFVVAHDTAHPFRVLTNALETTVLGTSFTVRAVPGQGAATVRVRTGRVRVQARAGAGQEAPAPVVLRPNQEVVYTAAAPALRPVLTATPVQLQPQPLVFDAQPVAEVLASLQAAYGVPIRYDGAALMGCTVTLAFGPTDGLADKLDLLCRTLGASYERTDEVIIFRSRGCQSE